MNEKKEKLLRHALGAMSTICTSERAVDRSTASGTAKRHETGDLGQAEKAEAASMGAEGERRAADNKALADTHATEALEAARRRDKSRATRRPKLTPAEQSAEFERIAREHGAEGDEKEFDEALRKLAKPRAD